MTRYWLKIGIGALLVFIVGMGIKYLVDQGHAKVHALLESDQPISIPLKFVDFRVDGQRLGQLQRLRLVRSAPKQFTGAELTVALDSGVDAEPLRNCQLRIDDLDKMDQNTTFVCVQPGTPPGPVAFEPFGTVTIKGTDMVLTLLLPSEAVQDLRSVADSLQAMDSAAAHVTVDTVDGVDAVPQAPATPAAPPLQAPAKTSVTP